MTTSTLHLDKASPDKANPDLSNISVSDTSLRNTSIPVTDPEAGLRISEVFYSLQGEALTSGIPTVFIRLTGCPLRCVYCDTAYAFQGGQRQSLSAILAQANDYGHNHGVKHVCVTGGEPLAQPNVLLLMKMLCDAGFQVSLETAGALCVAQVDDRVSKVMDIKTPSSGEADKNRWENLQYLTKKDQLKFVIMNRADYDWAKTMLITHGLCDIVDTVWFSPMFNVYDSGDKEKNGNNNPDKSQASVLPALATTLAEWILTDGLPVRFQLQLHKLLWADAQGK